MVWPFSCFGFPIASIVKEREKTKKPQGSNNADDNKINVITTPLNGCLFYKIDVIIARVDLAFGMWENAN